MLVGDEEENGLADVSAADADVVQATKARAGSRGPPCRPCRGGRESDPPVRHQRLADLPRRCREVKDLRDAAGAFDLLTRQSGCHMARNSSIGPIQLR